MTTPKKSHQTIQCIQLLLLLCLLITSCKGQKQTNLPAENQSAKTPTLLQGTPSAPADAAAPIAEYVVETFEDKKGNLWFGTLSKGAARFDGKTLVYFSTKEGLCDNTVTCIIEDQEGIMWFGTHSGLSRFDGRTFANFTTKEGLCNDRVSNILIDKSGNLWVGTWSGVCRFDGSAFTKFTLPNPELEIPDYQETTDWVTEIMEDRHGNIWFSRSGHSVCKFDGVAFTHFTKKDGLPSNCVQSILEDRQGNLWFGTRVAERDHPDAEKRTGDGGLSRFNGKTFIQYPELKGLCKNDVYSIYEDKSGNIWIGATGLGVYRYDGKNFTLFNEIDRKDLAAGFGVQSILEDKNGTLWFGFSGGLFRFNGTSFVHVPQGGPWK